MGSLFRLHVGSGEVTGYRSAFANAETAKLIRRIHLAMLNENVLLTPNCSGAMSTPMTEVEVKLIADKLLHVVETELGKRPQAVA
jgi:glutamate-1-semialdehyde 2,1-aminomutase